MIFRALGFPVEYRIIEEYDFEISEPTEFRLAVFIPGDGPYQNISEASIDGFDYEITDYNSFQVAQFEGEITEDTNIEIKYTAKMDTKGVNWKEEVKFNYTKPENGIESDNEVMINQANLITEGTSLEDVKNIYDFVIDNLEWRTESRVNVNEKSALKALETGEGVCIDFSILMAALCRARGIPAKSISGFSLPPLVSPYNNINGRLNEGANGVGSHGWVEFYADGKWYFSDPSWEIFKEVDGRHLSFGEDGRFYEFYDKYYQWAEEEDANFISGMSAPLKYVASASNEDVNFTPAGGLNYNLKGIIFWVLAVLIVIIIEVSLRKRKTKKE